MEEPPKIERIVSSQGVSLQAAATLMKAYLSVVDQRHRHHENHPLNEGDDDERAATSRADDRHGDDAAPRKTWQQREEDMIIAQMDELVDGGPPAGMIPDDIRERLRAITESICAEAEGRRPGAGGSASKSRRTVFESNGSEGLPDKKGGAGEFLAELEEAELLEQKERQGQEERQPRRQEGIERGRKKKKKAKKAAKKARKAAKRKATEMDDGGPSSLKRPRMDG